MPISWIRKLLISRCFQTAYSFANICFYRIGWIKRIKITRFFNRLFEFVNLLWRFVAHLWSFEVLAASGFQALIKITGSHWTAACKRLNLLSWDPVCFLQRKPSSTFSIKNKGFLIGIYLKKKIYNELVFLVWSLIF